MYAYYVTAAASGAILKAIKCRLVKDSEKEYLVCLKKHSIEVYSLGRQTNEAKKKQEDHNNNPVLTSSIEANSTFVHLVEYRPPGENQSHLLALTDNFLLVTFTYDEERSKFKTTRTSCLQESNTHPLYRNIIFKVDRGYNVLILYGHYRVIKFVVLNKNNYFDFTDVVTISTSDSLLMDIEFMSTEYRHNMGPKGSLESKSTSSRNPVSQENQFRSPTTNNSINYLECKLIVLGQDNNSPDNMEPSRWLYGMQLYFEIEMINGYKRFNSYSNSPLFGDPIQLSYPYNKFIPLNLNKKNNQYDSIVLLGPGSVGYTSFKNSKNVKNFKMDYSATEAACYLKYSENKYLFSDDNGTLYLMELLLSNTNFSTGLTRRVGSTVDKTNKTQGDLTVTDVLVKTLGSCCMPSSIVKLDDERIFYTSKMGQSSTIRIEKENKNEKEKQEYREWTHTNLGPITDFTYGEDTSQGTSPMLACCGTGESSTFCKINLGISSVTLFSNEVSGVSNLFCIRLARGDSVLCMCFYRFTRFYLVNLRTVKKRDDRKTSIIDLVETEVGEITNIKNEEWVYEEKTVLFDKLKNENIIQVTPTKVVLTNSDFKLVKRKNVSELEGNKREGEEVVESLVCGYYLLLILSNNVLVLLDYNLKVKVTRKLEFSVSSATYLSQTDLLRTELEGEGGEGLVAVSSWDSRVEVVTVPNLVAVYTYNFSMTFGTFIKSMKFAKVGSQVYLLTSISEGNLYIYEVLKDRESDKEENKLKFKLEEAMEINKSSFKLIQVKEEEEDTCDLSKVNIVTTGRRCTIIYLNNKKIEHAKTNINNVVAMTILPKWNNKSEKEYSEKEKKEMLTVHYDNKNIVISNLDVSKNMNVIKIMSGTNFNRVVYHRKSKLAAVSTIPQYVVDPNRLKTSKDILKEGLLEGEMYKSKKYLKRNNNNNKNSNNNNSNNNYNSNKNNSNKNKNNKEESSELSERSNELFQQGREEHYNMLRCMDDNQILDERNSVKFPRRLLLVDVESKEVVYSQRLPEEHLVASLHCFRKEETEYLAMGTAKVSEKNEMPTEGYLYLIEVEKTGPESYKFRVQRTSEPFRGGVVEITNVKDNLVIAVNSTIMALSVNKGSPPRGGMKRERMDEKWLEEAVGVGLSGVGGGSNEVKMLDNNFLDSNKVYKMEYVEKLEYESGSKLQSQPDKESQSQLLSVSECESEDESEKKEKDEHEMWLEEVGTFECNTYVVSLDSKDDILFVGDLMTSVKMLKLTNKGLQEECRDFNTLWTTAVSAVDELTCLVSDDSGNFTVFTKNKKPVNDHQSIRFETLGLFHHGEMINKIAKFPKMEDNHSDEVQIASKLGMKLEGCKRPFCCSNIVKQHEKTPVKRYKNVFKSLYTCATSSGSILQVCFFDDLNLFLRLTLLEETLHTFQKESGNYDNKNYRNFRNKHTVIPQKGFIDGDLVESYIQLPQSLRNKVFQYLKLNSDKIGLGFRSVDDLVSEIENLKQSRLQ